MPIHTVNLIKRGLEKAGKELRGSNILVLGIAYKANISDTRESPAKNVIEELLVNGAKIKVYDPYAESIKTRLGTFHSEGTLKDNITPADCIVILVDHDDFKGNQEILKALKDETVVWILRMC